MPSALALTSTIRGSSVVVAPCRDIPVRVAWAPTRACPSAHETDAIQVIMHELLDIADGLSAEHLPKAGYSVRMPLSALRPGPCPARVAVKRVHPL